MNASLKNQIFDVTIDAFTHEGRGVCTLPNGKRCFVSQALPGETMQIRIIEDKKNIAVGQIEQLFSSSPDRRSPRCPHFGVCGGCELQHIDEKRQIQLKQTQLLEQLEHFGSVSPREIVAPLVAEPWAYRRKARIGLRYVIKKQKMVMGFREQASRYLTDSYTCSVLRSEVTQHWESLRILFESFENRLDIPQLEIAVGDDALAIIVRHLTPINPSDMQKLISFAEQHQIHIYLQPKGLETIHRIWPEGSAFPDRLQYHLKSFGITFHFHPTDFVQVNGAMNEQMVVQALKWLQIEKTDRVLDLFCGLGNFSLPMAQLAHSVVAVEGSAPMVERLKENAKINHLENIVAYVLNLEEPVLTGDWLRKQYQKLLIDPPRAGAKEVIPYLKEWNPSRVVYVSCNPATLARDAGLLKESGYILDKICAMDMFTHTQHTEAMALFIRGDHG